MTPFTLYTVLVYFQMNYGLLLYLKLARVDVGNVSKKGENMEGIITLNIFTSWFFNRTLSIYLPRKNFPIKFSTQNIIFFQPV